MVTIMSKFIDIEVMALFQRDQRPIPLRFRYTNDNGEQIVVKVTKVISIEGNLTEQDPLFVYKCISIIDNKQIEYEIGLRLKQNNWYLRVN